MAAPARSALVALLALLALLAATSALAQPDDRPAVTFPAAQDKATLAAWLRKETDVDTDSVVAVTPDAVLAILQSRVVDGATAVIVRGEVLTPEAQARDKVLSWHATVQVDCARGRVRQGATTGYAARNLLFDGAPIREADAAWSTPQPGDPLDQVRRAACEKGFRGPLASGEDLPTLERPVAEAPATAPAPPPPAPRPAAPPPRPARAAKVSVQIAAAGSEAEAAGLLARLKRRHGPAMASLDTRIVKAEVKGRTVHRALVVGFADREAAAAFCRDLRAVKDACFVRFDLG